MSQPSSRLIETEALIVAYAMSRLDRLYLQQQNCRTWKDAFRQASHTLEIPPASIKNLRDEFDPVHSNPRRGWHRRPLRPNRQRVLGELCEVSDEALLEIVDRILARDADAAELISEPLSQPSYRTANVAERLRTGRLAEEYFIANSQRIVDIEASFLLDARNEAAGYDFGVRGRSQLAIEIKGLKNERGSILFTDREWHEARVRGTNYWVVIIGSLETSPLAKIVRGPHGSLAVRCVYQRSVAVSWTTAVSVA